MQPYLVHQPAVEEGVHAWGLGNVIGPSRGPSIKGPMPCNCDWKSDTDLTSMHHLALKPAAEQTTDTVLGRGRAPLLLIPVEAREDLMHDVDGRIGNSGFWKDLCEV